MAKYCEEFKHSIVMKMMPPENQPGKDVHAKRFLSCDALVSKYHDRRPTSSFSSPATLLLYSPLTELDKPALCDRT